ncbi:MAG: N-6 DNA methylase, partial [Candidatus Methanofastidiosa archaeon]|nr:N-6 DNA methylase [Candidatus Methanofastidiosa archaeon]
MAKIHQKLPTNWTEREVLRDKGQFWTPNWVAEAMVAYVIRNTEVVFDPATGRGAFYEALIKLGTPNVSFYGTDIDTEVLKDEIYNQRNCRVERRDFIKDPPNTKFKAIVANPPYIRHHRIDEETKAFLKNLARKITGVTIDGRAGYHIYFLIQALNLLETKGRLAFIMPADTCEGTFAKKLWSWISGRFEIEAVITFDDKATPFPNVDTNALIFLIKNSPPKNKLFWIKVKEAYHQDLITLIKSSFKKSKFKTLDIVSRDLSEAINTGLSRPQQINNGFAYHLYDFAKVMRGIATGANEFFFLSKEQIMEFGIPKEFLKRAIGRTKDSINNTFTINDLVVLEEKGRPTYLLSIEKTNILPESVKNYIRLGEEMDLPSRALIRQRKPWYKMEQRETPPILFAYLGRRNTRFILNEAGVLPLTGFLCVYPNYSDKEYISNLWEALNHPDTLKNLHLVGKSYGSGALKVEPSNLNKLPIPDNIV